jgi:hypothetical protein
VLNLFLLSIRGTENHGDRFLIPGYDLASLLSLRFVVLPAKVITFPESSKLFVEESKTLPSDFCLKTSVTVTHNVLLFILLGVTLALSEK